MDDNICTMVQRILDVGTQEGIVYDDHDSVRMSHACNIPDIDQAKRRVARGFDPDQFRFVWPYQLGNVDFEARRECDLDAMRSCDFGEISVCTAVHVRDRDDV